jgi:hypothetical protein
MVWVRLILLSGVPGCGAPIQHAALSVWDCHRQLPGELHGHQLGSMPAVVLAHAEKCACMLVTAIQKSE